MLSDGKLIALMIFLYLGILCLLDIIPSFNIFATKNLNKMNIKPLKVLFLALTITFFVGMLRILPVLDMIETYGRVTKQLSLVQAHHLQPQRGCYVAGVMA